jgi:L-threonylcarbamoyladenylate synthase
MFSEAVDALKQGGVIAYPTEAVFGLGCDPCNAAAVAQLLTLKQRPVEKGLILIAADYNQLLPFIDLQRLPDSRRQQILNSWPGPVTWTLPKSAQCPEFISGSFDTVAVRVSAHPVVQTLCLEYGGAIVSTSANLAGDEPARTAATLAPQLVDKLAAVIDRAVGGRAAPSEIRDGVTGAILRPS